MALMSEYVLRFGVVGVVFALGTVEPGGLVGVNYGEGGFLPEFKVLSS